MPEAPAIELGRVDWTAWADEPFPLYRVLERNGYGYASKAFPDGRFEIEIWEK